MDYHLTFSELSKQQIVLALDYYNEISILLADEFEEDLAIIYNRLKQHPHHYFNLNKQFRRISLSHFPYRIIYRIFESNHEVFIAALFHQRTNPRRIKKLK